MKPVLPISIVIPALNEEVLLPRLLRSIQDQEIHPLEVIVAVSPKTTDRTAEVAKEHKAMVVEGGIIGVARNNGAAVAKGKYLLFLDADSTLPSDFFIADLYTQFEKHKLDLASIYVDVDETELTSSRWIDRVGTKAVFQVWNTVKRLNGFLKQVFVESGTGLFVRKSVFDAVKGFKEDKEIIGEDYEFSKRIISKGYRYKVLPIKVVTSTRRYKGVSRTSKALLGAVIFGGLITLGFYNSNRIMNLGKRLYGDLGGAPKK